MTGEGFRIRPSWPMQRGFLPPPMRRAAEMPSLGCVARPFNCRRVAGLISVVVILSCSCAKEVLTDQTSQVLATQVSDPVAPVITESSKTEATTSISPPGQLEEGDSTTSASALGERIETKPETNEAREDQPNNGNATPVAQGTIPSATSIRQITSEASPEGLTTTLQEQPNNGSAIPVAQSPIPPGTSPANTQPTTTSTENTNAPTAQSPVVIASSTSTTEPSPPSGEFVVLEVPLGTLDRIAEGDTVEDVMPPLLLARVGQTFIFRNLDSGTHFYGPVTARPGETVRWELGTSGDFTGYCSAGEFRLVTLRVLP